ncbi:MAG: alpha/beta fold hydrolase [Acidimicrobiales bacterium]|nr:alpha/beta fold hydrolase [Acidimicrobiales bacterium]
MSVPGWIVPLAMRLLDAVSPYIAARLASVLFWHLGKPSSVRAVDRKIHESATVEQMVFGRAQVTVYTWGTGNSVILLVHGWRSRASRFSHLVKTLVSDGHMLVSFDAPGHGASGKGPSSVVEWAGIIRELEARYGRFDAVVGHSFGVLAAFHAVRMGVTTGRMVTIAGVHSLEHLVTSFTRVIRLPTRARVRFRDRINQQVFVDSPFEWGQIVAQLDSDSSWMPLLVVHDSSDAVVGINQAGLIADGHADSVSVMYTEGLGHNRILDDQRVVDAVTEFVSTQVESRVQNPVQQENGASNRPPRIAEEPGGDGGYLGSAVRCTDTRKNPRL